MAERALFRATVKALLEPRRLVPILLVSVPLVVAQGSMSHDPLAAPLGVLTCRAFVLLAPLSWRVLFPDDREHGQAAVRLLLYAGEGAGVVLVLGVVIPKLLDMGSTFLTNKTSLAISGALFLVGGWGLGRDIGFEASLARERARGAALAREAEQAQLLALRAHLDPHFLFNTLNAIAEWCRQDGETAERAVLQLSAMLRALLAGVRAASWPLERELALVRDLFLLHQVRDRGAFSLRWEVADEAGAVPVPPLVLLPLAENAVKHGPAAGHRGEIAVAARLDGAAMVLSIANPGPYRGPRAGSAGLPTVERRLALAYGGAARLSVTGAEEGRTRVELVLPRQGPVVSA
jgi:two-component system sensor histidine kinase AlgZ